ncbi:MAG: type II toxin-antitoxin system RelE/ParE family toxin [Deltaproteobacteria bacterium]|nr:type II toxin-antitoxin system RelE/ParE family toxin [Deltaproteobacteria bacterium]
MRRLFIEAEGFRKRVDALGGLALLADIQSEILKNPGTGKVVPGLAGVRKMRTADVSRGKGKRGGFRVLYLDLPGREKTYLLWIYGKNESEDISSDEKRVIKDLASYLKKEATI